VVLGDGHQCAGGTLADGLGDFALDALLVKRPRQRPIRSLTRTMSGDRAMRADGGEQLSCSALVVRRSPSDEWPTPTVA